MKLTRWIVAGLVICATAVASDGPKGTVPRATPDKYEAHAEHDGVGVGATLLTPTQARKVFSAEIDRCCMVVEVAIYPQKDGLAEVSLNDFALRIAGKDIASRPSSAEVVAGKLQRQAETPPHGPDVGGSVGVGQGRYDEIDPVTGQRRTVRTVTTGAGVGVGIGGPPPPPRPGSSDEERRALELELKEKGLPEGNTAVPVSGYIYFSLSQKKNAKYQLEYTLDGGKVVLPLH